MNTTTAYIYIDFIALNMFLACEEAPATTATPRLGQNTTPPALQGELPSPSPLPVTPSKSCCGTIENESTVHIKRYASTDNGEQVNTKTNSIRVNNRKRDGKQYYRQQCCSAYFAMNFSISFETVSLFAATAEEIKGTKTMIQLNDVAIDMKTVLAVCL